MSGETKPFVKRLMDGKSFEDFCNDVLWRNGIALGLYRSKERQWVAGESRLGAEVKYDGEAAKTGNLFIETEERRDVSGNSEWRPAGIYDQVESWLYVIGNYHCIWIFSTRFLQQLHKTERYRFHSGDTSKGFLLPVTDAEKYYARKIYGQELTSFFESGKRLSDET